MNAFDIPQSALDSSAVAAEVGSAPADDAAVAQNRRKSFASGLDRRNGAAWAGRVVEKATAVGRIAPANNGAVRAQGSEGTAVCLESKDVVQLWLRAA